MEHKVDDFEACENSAADDERIRDTRILASWINFLSRALLVFFFVFLIFRLILSVMWAGQTTLNARISRTLYDLDSQDTSSIQDICNVTMYPTECMSTLQGLKDLSWPSYVKVTLKEALLDVEEAYTGWKSSLDASITKNGIQYSTMQQCVEDYSSAESSIKDSLAIVNNLDSKPPLAQLNDLNQYISAAATFHSDCLDAIQDYGLVADDDIPFASTSTGLQLTEILSNALALIMN